MSRYQTQKGVIFEAEVRRYMKLRHITGGMEGLRAHTTIGSSTTILKYMDDPEAMPVGKMAEIFRALKIPKEERLSLLNKLFEGER